MDKALVGRYAFVRQIGKGGFGAVDQYRDIITNEDVAIKTIPSSIVDRESKRLIREVDLMRFLHDAHPHVIGYFSMFVTRSSPSEFSHTTSDENEEGRGPDRSNHLAEELNVLGERYEGKTCYEMQVQHHDALSRALGEVRKTDSFDVHIVMPLMMGDLFYFIKLVSSKVTDSELPISPAYLTRVAVVFAFQICFGVDYLHKCGIVHRDMKPDNVLVRLNIENPYMSVALIADLGLARDVQNSETVYVCTRYYRPPELVTSVSHGSTSIDIWSLGCIFYEMCTGETLFTMKSALNENGAWDGAKASMQLEVILNTIGTPSSEDIMQYMPRGNAKSYLQRSKPRPSILEGEIRRKWCLQASETDKAKWIDLITRCLAFFPSQRPTAEELCCHSLFRDYAVFYGENVKQHATKKYMPSCNEILSGHTNPLIVENKRSVLELIQQALSETSPLLDGVEEEETCYLKGDVVSEAHDDNFSFHSLMGHSAFGIGCRDPLVDEESSDTPLSPNPSPLTVEKSQSGGGTCEPASVNVVKFDTRLNHDHIPAKVAALVPSSIPVPLHSNEDSAPVQTESPHPGTPSSLMRHPLVVEDEEEDVDAKVDTAVGASAIVTMATPAVEQGTANSNGAMNCCCAREVADFLLDDPACHAASSVSKNRPCPRERSLDYSIHSYQGALVSDPSLHEPIDGIQTAEVLADFPFISDAALRQRYMSFELTDKGIQAAITSALDELHACTHDPVRSKHLRELLHFFAQKQKTGER